MLRNEKLYALELENSTCTTKSLESIAESQINTLLQTLRENAGLNKTALARRLGITPPAITRLEKRPAQASFSTLSRYAKACGFHLYLCYN